MINSSNHKISFPQRNKAIYYLFIANKLLINLVLRWINHLSATKLMQASKIYSLAKNKALSLALSRRYLMEIFRWYFNQLLNWRWYSASLGLIFCTLFINFWWNLNKKHIKPSLTIFRKTWSMLFICQYQKFSSFLQKKKLFHSMIRDLEDPFQYQSQKISM